MNEKLTHTMELAEAQMLGFHECCDGGSLESLISAMALEKKEWEIIKKEMGVSYLSKKTIQEIDDLLKRS